MMSLEYVSLKIPRPHSLENFVVEVEVALASKGKPIRWAMTSMNQGQAEIEAVVWRSPQSAQEYPQCRENL